jgi:hypothetical protein
VGFDGCWRAAFTADANESLEADGGSGLIVIGLDKGDGLVIRFAASVDEARGGIFTSRGTSCRIEFCSADAFEAGGIENAVGEGFGGIDRLASRLEA